MIEQGQSSWDCFTDLFRVAYPSALNNNSNNKHCFIVLGLWLDVYCSKSFRQLNPFKLNKSPMSIISLYHHFIDLCWDLAKVANLPKVSYMWDPDPPTLKSPISAREKSQLMQACLVHQKGERLQLLSAQGAEVGVEKKRLVLRHPERY